MRREIDLREVSDGKLYDVNDMAKLGCQDCEGCSACCRGMGESIILDPLDVFRITLYLDRCFEEMLNNEFELNVVDGIILPYLNMGENEVCPFLNKSGRCDIHSSRPGICRIFPLGRYYDNHDFKYFLQKNECAKKKRTKVKVGKWVDVPDYEKNKEFVLWRSVSHPERMRQRRSRIRRLPPRNWRCSHRNSGRPCHPVRWGSVGFHRPSGRHL